MNDYLSLRVLHYYIYFLTLNYIVLQEYFDTDQHPSLEKFLNGNQDTILAFTKAGDDLKSIWTHRYSTEAKRRNMLVVSIYRVYYHSLWVHIQAPLYMVCYASSAPFL